MSFGRMLQAAAECDRQSAHQIELQQPAIRAARHDASRPAKCEECNRALGVQAHKSRLAKHPRFCHVECVATFEARDGR
jgi:hypothetical protein